MKDNEICLIIAYPKFTYSKVYTVSASHGDLFVFLFHTKPEYCSGNVPHQEKVLTIWPYIQSK